MKKIYGFNKHFVWDEELPRVVGFKVVKETENQYKVEDNWHITTINKRTMEVSDRKYYGTREEAVKGLIAYCKRSVGYCENQINNEKAKMNRYQEVIKAYEKEIKQ